MSDPRELHSAVQTGNTKKERSGCRMHVVCVSLHIKAEYREAFTTATLENARHTLEEPGALRFDVIQQVDEPNRFLLYEVYRREEDHKAHRETTHFARWWATVSPWFAEPRQAVKYVTIFPTEASAWSAKK